MAKNGFVIGKCLFCRDSIYENEIWILNNKDQLAHLSCESKASEKDKKIADLETELKAAHYRIRVLERGLKKCLSEVSTKT
ncbi:hypothetical protein COJ96_10820 [Bacillus sp. AFS073361]|uniref:hypothetical protein n=1 Tax=Bacillus sp. AFS073361 TaxID=2033511 RepID=UPI000BF8EC10|nr:hypothetical protein [Bacillus sp. AFS073361]PFP29388.1 hypothetical protein COJ96_10820 [Bacillus sp. AFS073361]